MKYSLGISDFLEEIASLSHSIVSSVLLHWSLRKAFLALLAILWNSAFKWVYLSFSPLPSLLFSAIVRPPQTTILPFLHFFFLWMVLITELPPIRYHEPRTSVRSSLDTDYQI